MIVKILGPGCVRCQRLEQLTREVLAELGLTAEFEHVTEMNKIMAYPILGTPALVIDEQVKVAGRIPSREEIAVWLKAE